MAVQILGADGPIIWFNYLINSGPGSVLPVTAKSLSGCSYCTAHIMIEQILATMFLVSYSIQMVIQRLEDQWQPNSLSQLSDCTTNGCPDSILPMAASYCWGMDRSNYSTAIKSQYQFRSWTPSGCLDSTRPIAARNWWAIWQPSHFCSPGTVWTIATLLFFRFSLWQKRVCTANDNSTAFDSSVNYTAGAVSITTTVSITTAPYAAVFGELKFFFSTFFFFCSKLQTNSH